MAATQNIESLPKSRFFSELPYIYQQLLSVEELAGIKTWYLGDIVGVIGTLQRSGKGDLFVDMNGVELLTKSLRPPPEKHKDLIDTEQRYLKQNFQVETPMLQVIPGGATARPFVIHHNALDIDMYLRIAPELYLKPVIVGRFERVFEINWNFRNERLPKRRNPEFTVIEFYQAYVDYNDMMDLYRVLSYI